MRAQRPSHMQNVMQMLQGLGDMTNQDLGTIDHLHQQQMFPLQMQEQQGQVDRLGMQNQKIQHDINQPDDQHIDPLVKSAQALIYSGDPNSMAQGKQIIQEIMKRYGVDTQMPQQAEDPMKAALMQYLQKNQQPQKH